MHVDQPPPVPNDSMSVVDLVVADLAARKALGIARYGVALQPFNGRDAFQDAYEEAIDKALYLRQVQVEQQELHRLLTDLIREAQCVVNDVTIELGDDAVRISRLRGAIGRYVQAHQRTGLPSLPDPNQGYDHSRSVELARAALRTHPRDTDGRFTS